jgi:hypothetical protein
MRSSMMIRMINNQTIVGESKTCAGKDIIRNSPIIKIQIRNPPLLNKTSFISPTAFFTATGQIKLGIIHAAQMEGQLQKRISNLRTSSQC